MSYLFSRQPPVNAAINTLSLHDALPISGEIRSKHGVARAGSHIMLEHGDIFGPWVAGPEGCELYGFIAGEGSPFAGDRKSTRLNSSHSSISYAVFCLKKKK